MSDIHGGEVTALHRLGALFRELDQRDRSTKRTRLPQSTRGKLALAALAMLALVGCSLTPAGHTVTGKIARLVGIGEPATLPPEAHSDLRHRGQPVVLASGLAPDGSRYEIVADRTVVLPPRIHPV